MTTTTSAPSRSSAPSDSRLASLNAYMTAEFRKHRARVQAALSRARAHGGAKSAEPIGDRRYRVRGLRGSYFVALFDRETSRCTCTAGSYGQPCYHAAICWLYEIANAARSAA